ncbi:hypothetical protein [Nonomuraea cavernae]|uniref:Uncharacterized protein n=1 Tax=Nonomuraea cavernae TaxID=2045107 RepID=A0A917YX01_9ACTN|nr:hypothetical protein [Nonomuraea cavernae]MCA2185991.1 hypothetical protein [Nonomuraea cavernae]GGO69016.1 hypothetical protein GCM10012289_29090 [Nonomuraea cavernae]
MGELRTCPGAAARPADRRPGSVNESIGHAATTTGVVNLEFRPFGVTP